MTRLLRYIPPPHVSDRKWSEGDAIFICALGVAMTPLAIWFFNFIYLVLEGLRNAT